MNTNKTNTDGKRDIMFATGRTIAMAMGVQPGTTRAWCAVLDPDTGAWTDETYGSISWTPEGKPDTLALEGDYPTLFAE